MRATPSTYVATLITDSERGLECREVYRGPDVDAAWKAARKAAKCAPDAVSTRVGRDTVRIEGEAGAVEVTPIW